MEESPFNKNSSSSLSNQSEKSQTNSLIQFSVDFDSEVIRKSSGESQNSINNQEIFLIQFMISQDEDQKIQICQNNYSNIKEVLKQNINQYSASLMSQFQNNVSSSSNYSIEAKSKSKSQWTSSDRSFQHNGNNYDYLSSEKCIGNYYLSSYSQQNTNKFHHLNQIWHRVIQSISNLQEYKNVLESFLLKSINFEQEQIQQLKDHFNNLIKSLDTINSSTASLQKIQKKQMNRFKCVSLSHLEKQDSQYIFDKMSKISEQVHLYQVCYQQIFIANNDKLTETESSAENNVSESQSQENVIGEPPKDSLEESYDKDKRQCKPSGIRDEKLWRKLLLKANEPFKKKPKVQGNEGLPSAKVFKEKKKLVIEDKMKKQRKQVEYRQTS